MTPTPTEEDLRLAREFLYGAQPSVISVEALAAFRAEARREAELLADFWEAHAENQWKHRQSEREACERIVAEEDLRPVAREWLREAGLTGKYGREESLTAMLVHVRAEARREADEANNAVLRAMTASVQQSEREACERIVAEVAEDVLLACVNDDERNIVLTHRNLTLTRLRERAK